MTKSKKVFFLLVLALICAIISGVAIYSYCNASKGFVYVFNSDYKAGTKITSDMFKSIKVDNIIIDNGKKSSLDTYYITGDDFKKVVSSNEYLLNDVSTNQPLTFTDLAYTSGTSIERSLSGDNMAVTIPISGSAAVTDDLRVGSIVNIYSTSSSKTELLFENMKVIARNDGDSLSSVTFETDFDDTLALINAANNYKLYFALVDPVSDESKASGAVNKNEVSTNSADSSNTDLTGSTTTTESATIASTTTSADDYFTNIDSAAE